MLVFLRCNITRALLRLERTMNLLCHLVTRGREGGRERGGREGSEGVREK